MPTSGVPVPHNRPFKRLSIFSKKEIDWAFNHAKCLHKVPGLTLLASPKQLPTLGRVLIVAPRAVGNAPERNKLRRQIKAIFYEQRLFEGTFDCLVLLKKGATHFSFEALKSILTKVIQ